jgi:hypothetical protein
MLRKSGSITAHEGDGVLKILTLTEIQLQQAKTGGRVKNYPAQK